MWSCQIRSVKVSYSSSMKPSNSHIMKNSISTVRDLKVRSSRGRGHTFRPSKPLRRLSSLTRTLYLPSRPTPVEICPGIAPGYPGSNPVQWRGPIWVDSVQNRYFLSHCYCALYAAITTINKFYPINNTTVTIQRLRRDIKVQKRPYLRLDSRPCSSQPPTRLHKEYADTGRWQKTRWMSLPDWVKKKVKGTMDQERGTLGQREVPQEEPFLSNDFCRVLEITCP